MSLCLLSFLNPISGIGLHGMISRPYQEALVPIIPAVLKIKTQPTDQADCKGNKVTFSIAMEGGSGAVHYLWKRKRVSDVSFLPFGAADSTRLPVYNIGVGTESPDGTQYQVTVSDQDTTLISEPASLTVNQITGIAPTGVASYTVKPGDNLWLKVLTSGKAPIGFQWIRKYGAYDWRDVADHETVSGSQLDKLSFTGIAVSDSGIYKVRVIFPTIDGNQCTETSAITRKINVTAVADTEPPRFANPGNTIITVCPDDLSQAYWSDSIASILPAKVNSYLIHKATNQFDLPVSLFSDNMTPPEKLVLHWGMFSDDALQTAVKNVAGTLLDDMMDQISHHAEEILLTESASSGGSWHIDFWLEDEAHNLTPVAFRHRINIRLAARPEIMSQF